VETAVREAASTWLGPNATVTNLAISEKDVVTIDVASAEPLPSLLSNCLRRTCRNRSNNGSRSISCGPSRRVLLRPRTC